MIHQYEDALEFLDSLVYRGLTLGQALSIDVNRPNRVSLLLQALGNPHTTYPIIHVAGTKGKGSVSAMLASILAKAGYRVGLYTSPHLQDIRERFQINGEIISKNDFAEMVSTIRPIIEQVENARWPEAVVTLALSYFGQQHVDIAVVETGVGGRYDATNIMQPILSLLTTINYDHTDLLGTTLPEIATHKAGIIKRSVPVISAAQLSEVLAVIEAEANQQSAPLSVLGRDYRYDVHAPDRSGQLVTVYPDDNAQTYKTALLGEHQAHNAALALAAVKYLQDMGYHVTPAAIQTGLESVQWPGRLEVVGRAPSIVLDGAHNPIAMQVLRTALEKIFPEEPLALIFAAKSSKDIYGMLAEILPCADVLVLPHLPSYPLEMPSLIETHARRLGFKGEILRTDSLYEAIELGKMKATPAGIVCVTGSLFLIGETRIILTDSVSGTTLLSTN